MDDQEEKKFKEGILKFGSNVAKIAECMKTRSELQVSRILFNFTSRPHLRHKKYLRALDVPSDQLAKGRGSSLEDSIDEGKLLNGG